MRLTMRLRSSIIAAALVAALAWFNWQVLANERHVATGQPVLFELGTADPRSLIQGDYMILRYRLPDSLAATSLPVRGQLALRLDGDDVAISARLYTPDAPLAADELLVNYQTSDGQLNVGPGSFFFQEGEAETYGTARYAELRLLPGGASLLVGLRDEAREPLGRPIFP